MGGGQLVEDAITDLGLRHSLLTPFTSFVAVDHEIANPTRQSTNRRPPRPMPLRAPVPRGPPPPTGRRATARQPLPMPQGVSNMAVAQEGSAPAKSTMGYG